MASTCDSNVTEHDPASWTFADHQKHVIRQLFALNLPLPNSLEAIPACKLAGSREPPA